MQQNNLFTTYFLFFLLFSGKQSKFFINWIDLLCTEIDVINIT